MRRKTKKFVCNYCGKDFNKESQLKRHKKDKHPESSDYVLKKQLLVMY